MNTSQQKVPCKISVELLVEQMTLWPMKTNYCEQNYTYREQWN